jgi:hypothetical protein
LKGLCGQVHGKAGAEAAHLREISRGCGIKNPRLHLPCDNGLVTVLKVTVAGLFSLHALLKGAFSLMFLPNGKKPTAEESVTLHACRMRNDVFT